MMTPVLYDGSFDGFLSAVFFVFEQKITCGKICRNEMAAQSLFSKSFIVESNESHVNRVWKALGNKISPAARKQLYDCFLSEIRYIENVMLRYIQYVFASKRNIESDYSHPDVLFLKQVSGKVHREKHRMEAFVRFQQLKDGLFFAMVQPDYNVLPLIAKHFTDRYADQRWLIYDAGRKYGIYYNLDDVEEVQFNFSGKTENGTNLIDVYDEKEWLYQVAWKQYFNSVNIAPRKNMKLHLQHMPRRYWKFLTEKKEKIVSK